MGKDITFRYAVELTLRAAYATPAPWPTRATAGLYRPATMLGKPNAAKLAQYVTDYNVSLGSGKCNGHLDPQKYTAIKARIVDYSNSCAVVCTWQADARDQ